MPIPTKPLREMLREALEHEAGRVIIDCDEMATVVDTLMRALAEYDPCFAKAAEKMEPSFTLRAQDITADRCVDAWADKFSELVAVTNDFSLRWPGFKKARQARRIAEAMRAWPNRKLPE